MTMIIEGKEVLFLRDDGAQAEGVIYEGGEGPDGELMFFELIGLARPMLKGKEKYARLFIRRVFPYIKSDEQGETTKT